MRLLGCNQKCISTKDIYVCGLLQIGRLRLVSEADSFFTNDGDLLLYDYLTIEEEDDSYGENN